MDNRRSFPYLVSRVPASLLRRLGAILYDTLILLALFMVGTGLLLPFLAEQLPPIEPADIRYQLYLLAIAFLYLVFFWTRGGQTLGMLAWRLRVVVANTNGNIGFRTATLRFFTALLSWLAAGLGFWWCLFDAEWRCWHDILSGSRLVLVQRTR